MWVEDGATATVSGTSFLNNSAASSYTHKGTGGAVAVSSSATLSLSEASILEGNSAGPEV